MGQVSIVNINGVDYDIRDKILEKVVEGIQPVNNYGTINNAQDEEDITTDANNLLKFKDRAAVDGMGYVILRKNKTFAEQVTKADTIYEIRYDFDLDGASVTIPQNCVLEFNGGSLSNGTIDFNSCIIKADENQWIFKNLVDFSNLVECSIKWFGAKGDTTTDDTTVFKFVLDNYHELLQIINFPTGTYILSDSINQNSLTDTRIKNQTWRGTGADPNTCDTWKNYTEIKGCACFVFLGDIATPCIENVKEIHNIYVRGEQSTTTPSYGEKEVLPIYSNTVGISSYGNFILSNCVIRYMGVGIRQDYTYNCKIDKVRICNCRTGLSVSPTESYITTGTYITWLNITNTSIIHCEQYGMYAYSSSINNFINCELSDVVLETNGFSDYDVYGNLHIEGSKFNITFQNSYFETSDVRPNSPLEGKEDHIGIYIKGNFARSCIVNFDKIHISNCIYGAPGSTTSTPFTRYMYISNCSAKISNADALGGSIFFNNDIINNTQEQVTLLQVDNSTFYQIDGNNLSTYAYRANNVSLEYAPIRNKKANNTYYYPWGAGKHLYYAITFEDYFDYASVFHDLQIMATPMGMERLLEKTGNTLNCQTLTIFSNSLAGEASTNPVVISSGYGFLRDDKELIEKVSLSHVGNKKVVILQRKEDRDVYALIIKSNLAITALETYDSREAMPYTSYSWTDTSFNSNEMVNCGPKTRGSSFPDFGNYGKQYNIGRMFFETTKSIPSWWNGTAWVSSDGYPSTLLRKGTTAQRPTPASSDAGFQYYDTDLGKYICWNSTAWVNMDGTSLSTTTN